MKRFGAALAIVVLLCGCQAVKQSTARFGKDLLVVAVSPVHLPVAMVSDVCGAEEPSDLHPVMAIVQLPLSGLKHLLFTLAYAGDALLYPLYLPFGLEPWDLYVIDGFPFTVNHAEEEVIIDPISIWD
jgi:hypothetical protein